MLVRSIVFSVLVFSIVKSAELPKYIKTCKADQSTINACALKSAREAVSDIVKGDKKYNVPKLNPLILPLVEGVSAEKLKFVFHNLNIFGVETIDLKSIDIDLKGRTLKGVAHIDSFTFFGPYEISGQILVLPISGKGDCNITLINGDYTFNVGWSETDKGGKKFMKIDNFDLTFDAKDAYYHLTGLFNNDEKLGDHMNKFLNENSKDVTAEIGSSIIKVMEPVVASIYKSYMELVPIDVVFPPK